MILKKVGILEFKEIDSYNFPEAVYNQLAHILSRSSDSIFFGEDDEKFGFIVYEKCSPKDILI